MKKLLLIIFAFVLSSLTIKAQVVLDANGVTIKWTGTTAPSPYFVQASPRGTLEWFAIVSNTTKSNISDYANSFPSGISYFTRPGSSTTIPFNNIVTSLVTNMDSMFFNTYSFNENIGSWDVSNVTSMNSMFEADDFFNQSIGSWNVSNVTDMSYLFAGSAFNQPIGSWNVSNVTDMSYMFISPFNQPIDTWNVSNVTNMHFMFAGSAFNQPIGSWNVSNVTDMNGMFFRATSFNQPIGFWDVSKVTDMSLMFIQAYSFNQNIGSWNVSNVTVMSDMFQLATAFNQNIGSWDVSNVTDIRNMFSSASAFNQPIGNWNVGKVTDMGGMFDNATSFNQPIGNWNVSNVRSMYLMFINASSFNQNIGSWNVSNVTAMNNMFAGAGLSTANYDSLLIGWSTITSSETPLKQDISFDAGSSKYCNGASARASIISKYGWTITDGGLDCSSLGIEEFETSKLKLYPNPVESILNINIDYRLIDKPYTIIDGLGRIVLEGKLKEVESIINLKVLSKGIYYLKVSDGNSSKFIKE
jgi:surface protein